VIFVSWLHQLFFEPVTWLYMWLYYYGFTVLCWALAAFLVNLILYTVGSNPWTEDLPVARSPLYLHREQHKHNKLTQYRHLCLEWNSNPQSQRSSERRQFMPQTARPLWSAGGYVG
jgi:hypothetical protein